MITKALNVFSKPGSRANGGTTVGMFMTGKILALPRQNQSDPGHSF
ncbi:MAG: hypothetical protein QY306_00555 [Anaerolineales bacterium]|nr:MAG: hypothetical protein QY306_00555 [Anaerolineales bacterium]